MEDKDPKDEELNPQGQDDANEADDSFGLPDLDYKALDEEENESEAEAPVQEEPEEIASETVEESEEEAEEDKTEESAEEAETSYSYSSDEEESSDSMEEDQEEEEPQLRYQVEESSSNGPKILLGILGILIVAAVIWFFGYYRPQQQKLEEEARIKQEQIDRQKAAEAARLKEQQEAAAAATAEEARLQAEADALAKAGVQTITERTGRFYLVVGSFVDGDLAKDYGDKIAKSGTPSFLIPPYSKKKLQRIAIGGYDTFDEAQSALNGAMPEGVQEKGNWILKY